MTAIDLYRDDTDPGWAPDEDRPSDAMRYADILRTSAITGNGLKDLPVPDPLIDGMLYRGTLAAIYGPSGIGKSFVAMSMAMSVASGSWWQGREVRKGPILYVAAEGSFGLAKRRQAWMDHERVYNVDGDIWLPRAVNLLDPDWAAGLVELAKDVGPHLTVIDTVARSMQGGDENASRDMGALSAPPTHCGSPLARRRCWYTTRRATPTTSVDTARSRVLSTPLSRYEPTMVRLHSGAPSRRTLLSSRTFASRSTKLAIRA